MNAFRPLVLLICCFAISDMVSAKKTINEPFVLASIQPEGSKQRQLLVKIYTELFERMEVPLEIVNMPLKRASEDANSGKVDGQFGRIFEYGERYTNQQRVDFPIIQSTLLAFAHINSKININNGWDSLEGTRYSVEYQRGMLSSRMNLENRVKSSNLSSVTNAEQGLLKLKYRRTDIFIHTNGVALENVLKNPEFRGYIKPIAMMQTVFLYPYVHKKHKKMVPAMENTLQEMKKDGTIMHYCKEVYTSDSNNFCSNWPAVKFQF
ncbi:substrate-binding periplasmic protein [Vibrio salinus]|uniref:substrate-binding periplasmic protein n=1 Tax=Vibrio salinus TaxID=2899784 RepID=UPI001E48506D|nr:transporter substrate-binding domain-containing protein [Vibrio salinus]MCE0492485.1 transporter substrate-binding domain-containing protein [Vibrio salinus]